MSRAGRAQDAVGLSPEPSELPPRRPAARAVVRAGKPRRGSSDTAPTTMTPSSMALRDQRFEQRIARADQTQVDDLRLGGQRIGERLRDGEGIAAAGGVRGSLPAGLVGQELDVRRDADDADAVVGRGRDEARHLRAVAIAAERDLVVVDEIAGDDACGRRDRDGGVSTPVSMMATRMPAPRLKLCASTTSSALTFDCSRA